MILDLLNLPSFKLLLTPFCQFFVPRSVQNLFKSFKINNDYLYQISRYDWTRILFRKSIIKISFSKTRLEEFIYFTNFVLFILRKMNPTAVKTQINITFIIFAEGIKISIQLNFYFYLKFQISLH